MTQPKITPTIGGYDFIWETEGVFIKTTHVKVHTSDNRITGELVVCNLDDKLPIYPATSFNFNSDRTRGTLIKTLKELEPGADRDWQTIIHQVCVAVIKYARQGEQVQELWTSDEMEPPEYILEPILMKGLPTIIFGEKGVTKSTMAMLIYITLLLQWHENPFGWRPAPREVRSLILDYELPGSIAQWNAKKLVTGLGLDPVVLYHRHSRIPLADDIEAIQDAVERSGAEVLIIDSLARASGGDLVKTEPANAFFEALDKLHITSLILAQTSKDLETHRKTIYGNALFTYYARSIFELARSDYEGSSSDVLNVGLFHRWSNLSRLYPDVGFKFSFNSHSVNVERQAISVTEFKTKVKGRQALLSSLSNGSKTVKELAETLEWKEASIRPLLSTLKKAGKVVDLGDNTWGLAQAR